MQLELPTDADDDEAFMAKMSAAVERNGGADLMLGVRKHKSDIEVRPARSYEGMTALPPCLQAVADELQRGANPGHMGRFALASFLVKRDATPDEIHSFFKNAANYREATTNAQIESIVAKGYAPPGCDKLKKLGLCREDDTCRERCVETPMQYPRSAS